MIVGTAGHIDHGKTTLVHALTGVDTDRLKEEKARGISIELGYAYLPFEGGILGFVDVPGHERLIHTMVAGACGIDFALLVIAADDGVMPQTSEHMAVIRFLGIGRGAIALTKCDRVDPGRIEQVRGEIEALLADTVLSGAPIFEVCATCHQDAGVAALSAHLRACAVQTSAHASDGLFRMAVDRVFTLAGAGTIATGTVFGGSVGVGDQVWIAGQDAVVRVRSLHTYNREADRAHAGDRCALNLTGVRKDDIARGDWVVCKRLATASPRLDVVLTLLGDASLGSRQELRVHVHLGTMHRVARMDLMEGPSVSGSRAALRAQLIFDEPVHAVAGDRFIVRDAGATHTIGGGRVLDPLGPARKRASPERRAWLDAMVEWLDAGCSRNLIGQAPYGVTGAMLERMLGLPIDSMKRAEDVVAVPIKSDGGHDEWLIGAGRWKALGERIVETLRCFHQVWPDEQGVESARLRRMAAPQMDEALWRAGVGELLRAGGIERSGAWLHLPGYSVALTDEEQRWTPQVLALLHDGGVEPLWVRDVATSLDIPEERARVLLRKLARRGDVYQIVRDLFYDRDAIREVAHVVEHVASADEGRVTAAAFRDATGLGRKRAVQVLEFFDRVGYTRFCRDAHLLRGEGRAEERF